MADSDYPSYRAATGMQGSVSQQPDASPSYRFAVTNEKPSMFRPGSTGAATYPSQTQQPDPSYPSYRYAVTTQAPSERPPLHGSQASIHSTPATPGGGYFSGYRGSTAGSSRASSMTSVSTYPGTTFDAATGEYTVDGWPWRQPEPKRSLYGFTIGLSIFSFVCCCWPLSAVALVSACSSDKAWREGDELAMHQRGKLAVILIMLAAIFGAILIFCVVVAIRSTIDARSDSIFN